MLDVNVFDSMRISIASPDTIRQWSHGEVKKPETINYRTLKPERDGLFCERIFGPTRDWECHCGKYKRVRYKGTICDRCGVEVTRAKVRRERMGHIELAAPVSHIWYFKGIPSRMGLLLDMSPRALERVLYFASYIVLEPGDTDLKPKELLSEGQYRLRREQIRRPDFKGKKPFKVGMGAEAIQQLLRDIDLDDLSAKLRDELHSSNGQKRVRAIRRLEVVEAFRKSANKPEWMILTVIPVIPPELRPMVQLDGGRFATSDLNDLYRRVINRNNRLNRLLKLRAPDIIVRNEKRMLQEAVDALIDNGRRGRPVTGPGNRPLKSLSDMLKGKQGRFRQNLLGKRVDYSGRSVIVVGPELKLHQCGLPKEMALELFKPFVMKKLSTDSGLTIKAAKKKVERETAEVWAVLEDVIKEHPVLLNRAPTLHRLGIQAFEPVLTEGRALKLHPLACTAYNADFDGDQMAIHLPLSAEAQAEARVLMLAANHILAPKDGKPIIVPTQDMVLGTYYLTKIRKDAIGQGRFFTGFHEALLAYEHSQLHLQAEIFVRMAVPEQGKREKGEGRRDDDNNPPFPISHLPLQGKREMGEGIRDDDNNLPNPLSHFPSPLPLTLTTVKTTVGRMIFNEKLPTQLRQFHQDSSGAWSLGTLMNKKELARLVAKCFNLLGATKTAEVIDAVKSLGYHFACKAGMTVAISDVIVPPAKKTILANTSAKVKKVEQYFLRGILTERERYDKVVELWSKATDLVADAMMANMDEFNPIYMMSDSGARGNKQQMRQLAGMRGLMADPSGKIIDLPITANFREGLSVSDYFISSHGARKGLADTALRTADSGYLTRRLVDVAQDVIVRQVDCDVSTVNLQIVRAALAEDTFDALEILSDLLIGKVLAKDVVTEDSSSNNLITYCPTNLTLDEAALEKLGEISAPYITIRGSISDQSQLTQTIKLGTADSQLRAKIRHDFIHEHIGKTWLTADSSITLTHEILEQILDDDSLTTIQVRNNKVRPILLEEILEDEQSPRLYEVIRLVGDDDDTNLKPITYTLQPISSNRGVIEPLRDRIAGRVLAENIFDCHGVLIAATGQTIDEDLADKICAALNDHKELYITADDEGKREKGEGIRDDDNPPSPSTREKGNGIRDNNNPPSPISHLPSPLSLDEGKREKGEGIRDNNNPPSPISHLPSPLKTHLPSPFSLDKLKAISSNKLAKDFYDKNGVLIGKSGQVIDENLAEQIAFAFQNFDSVAVRSVLTCKSPQGVCIKCYGQDLANRTQVEVGEAVGIIAAQSIGEPGTQLTMRTFHTGGVAGGDITQGLPRVEELFEARKPKMCAIIAEIAGTVSFEEPDKNNLRQLIITPQDTENQQPRHYTIPFGSRLRVEEGQQVTAGQELTDGAKNPHDILRVCGLKETYRYLVKEVQKVYKSQGVEINDKHIEVMVRQMLHKVKIEESGSTDFLPGEFIDINAFESANTRAIEEGQEPAVAKPILLGITKASLATDSFLSAASFQETTRVLTDAAIKGKVDPLVGLKENVIIGKLIPAGTGMARYRELTVVDKEAESATE